MSVEVIYPGAYSCSKDPEKGIYVFKNIPENDIKTLDRLAKALTNFRIACRVRNRKDCPQKCPIRQLNSEVDQFLSGNKI